LEVCYTIAFPHYLDSPFLQEEKELIDALGKLFSIFLDQWHTLSELQEKESLIRKITEQIPGNTYQFELDAMGNIRFLFASKGFAANNLSISAEQMRLNPNQILSLIHPEDWERFIDSMKAAHKNPTEIDIQYRILSNGEESWRWLKATAEKDKNGKVIWYGSTQDITQIINYIDVLEQVLFDISHVMRKPVATMLGLTDFLHDHENMDEKTLKDFAKHIRSVAGEIDQYIKNLNDTYVKKRHSINTATGQSLFQLLSKHKNF
jgi:signal transduction histidine kinase